MREKYANKKLIATIFGIAGFVTVIAFGIFTAFHSTAIYRPQVAIRKISLECMTFLRGGRFLNVTGG